MRFFACSLLLAAHGVAATSLDAHRVLRAATKRTDLLKRGVRIAKRFDAVVDYVEEENGWAGASTFASQVKVESPKPVLNLEEIEHHLLDVQCGDGTMKLSFVDTTSARDAYFSCQEQNGGLVITSHESCNLDGERAVYKITDVSFAASGTSLDLNVTPTSWNSAFSRLAISFGHTTSSHLFRRHSDFSAIRHKRQSPKIEIPANTPDNINDGTFDLSSQILDKNFALQDFLGLAQLPALPIEIGCRNCSTRGQIALSQGAIQIDISQIDLIPDFLQGGDDGKEIANLISGGFVALTANNVGATLELFARPIQSGQFEIALASLPVLGFAIPGIGRAGAVFEPRIAADFAINGGFELNYGVDVTIPNNSQIRLDLTNIRKSSITGFQDSALTLLPFKVNITNIDIALGLAFKPVVTVGFDFLDKLTAEAAVTLNLPRLDAKLSTNVAANCGANKTAPGANQTTTGLAALGPLVLVSADITVSADASIGLQIPLLPPPLNDVGVDANIFSKTFPLVTECVGAGVPRPAVTGIAGGNGNATATIGVGAVPGNATNGAGTTVYVMSAKATGMASMVHGVESKATPAASMVHVPPPAASMVHIPSSKAAPAASMVHVTSVKAAPPAASMAHPSSKAASPALMVHAPSNIAPPAVSMIHIPSSKAVPAASMIHVTSVKAAPPASMVHAPSNVAPPPASMVHLPSSIIVAMPISTPCNSTTVAAAKSTGNVMPTLMRNMTTMAVMASQIAKAHLMPVPVLSAAY